MYIFNAQMTQCR